MKHGANILIVDDEEVVRLSHLRSLSGTGCNAQVAEDGKEALQVMEQHPFDVILLDLRMPGRSGLELVVALKEVDASTRVLVLTGYGSISTAVDAIRLGAINFLPKPADVDDLLAAFERPDSTDPKASTDGYRAPSLARAEWEHIQRVLSDCGGNVSEAARRLGIHRRSLQRKLQKFAPD